MVGMCNTVYLRVSINLPALNIYIRMITIHAPSKWGWKHFLRLLCRMEEVVDKIGEVRRDLKKLKHRSKVKFDVI